MVKDNIRMGVDIGGTFTDIVVEIKGQQFSTKVLTTYGAPENAILEGMLQVCQLAKITPSQIKQIIHGTTLATNALIERRGAKTALITTKGFRDVIEMRTESRFEQYDLNIVLPEPLLPRYSRFVLEERLNAKGETLIALNRREVEELAEQIKNAGYESVAVGFLHSYLDPAHEHLVREVFAEKCPNIMVSLSSDVSPQMREYERFNTTIANAYIKPLMKSYLDRLKRRLEEQNALCPIFLMHSGGGVISIASAAEFSVRLVESGPAGGAVFAAHIAAKYDMDKVLSFDMGGTTAKICLIKNQTPKTARVFEVARSYRFKKGSGMPISIPVIDMVEIGAGGGSLAHIDNLQQIRVGPKSAGSEPGPACYGRGGQAPAVTDADLILGKLDPDNFAGGSIKLDVAASNKTLQDDIGEKLELDVQTAAFGVSEVVDENMANAARVHAVENGEDLSEYTMIAFGGAAPLHAARLCEKLGIKQLIIPPGAGVGSAIGFLRAPFSFEANKSIYMRITDFKAGDVEQLFVDLKQEATQFVRSCDANADILSDYKIYMRYVGQGWEIPVSITQEQVEHPNANDYLSAFEKEYAGLFGRVVEGMDVEITVWSVNATTPPQDVIKTSPADDLFHPTQIGTRDIFDPAQQRYIPAKIYDREQLQHGAVILGPAVITEQETSIILPSDWYAIRRQDGGIIMTCDKEYQA